MLILTRREGESLMIGDEISVTILSVKGNQGKTFLQDVEKPFYQVLKELTLEKDLPFTAALAPNRACLVSRRL